MRRWRRPAPRAGPTSPRPDEREHDTDRAMWELAREVTQLGVFEADTATGTLWWSPALHQIMGRDEHDFTPSIASMTDVLHPDDRDKVRAWSEEPLGVPLRARAVRPDGEVRQVIVWRRPTGDGREIGFVLDVTEQQEAELQRDADRERVALLIDLADVATFDADEQTGTVRWSPELYRLAGVDAGEFELTTESSLAIVHREDRRVTDAVLVDTFAGRPHEPVEIRIVRPDGSERLCIVQTRLVREGYLVGSIRDITDERAAKRRLEVEQLLWHEGQRLAHVGMVRADLREDRVFWSPEMYRIAGMEPERRELTLEAALSVIHPHDRALAQKRTSDAAASPDRTETRRQLRIVRPDGEIRWVDVRFVSLGDGRALATFWDITEQRAHETELRATVEQLRTHKEELERASQAKTQFLSRMSHELRTPLNAVLGYSQLMMFDELTPDHRDAVQHILHAGNHLLALVDEVLDITGVEAGAVTFNLEPVAVRAAVEAAMKLVLPMAADAGVSISTSSDASSTTREVAVVADRVRLNQVLVNLLSNAVKYNHRGGTVDVAVHDRHGTVDIAIADSGRGIEAAAFGTIFEPFARLDAEQLEIQGTGIGLPLARALSEGMHGRLSVRSDVGEGSTFTVTLPAASGRDASVPDRVELAPGWGSHGPAGGRSLHVVHIEDNEANRRLVEALLMRRWNVELTSAVDAKGGLALVRRGPVDLVLLDLHLPDMDGAEVIREIHTRASGSRPTIAVLSADANREQIERVLQVGADHYLTKPLDLEVLLGIVDRAASLVTGNGPG